ncbi:NAD-dependent epimerase/dehydratase family protein, partial [Rhizobiaceae bacterium]|nr:NAD-dependent epimerase/dehydratase family protein [Rhizobiaceae bacterium]
MRIMIIGAAGMLGRKLAAFLAREGTLAANGIRSLHLVDIVEPKAPAGVECSTGIADLTTVGAAEGLIAHRPDVIFHLGAIVSGEAEQDFERGYAVNFDGTRALLEAIRAAHGEDGYTPRLVFSSSVAVFG